MRIRKISFNKLLYNNRFLLIFSVIVAVIVWLIVAMQFSPEVERIVKDVPVKIEMSNSVDSFDLQIFGTKDFFVDVTVVGKRYVVAPTALSADDFSVTAKTNFVDSAGKYSLRLEIQPKSVSADFTIVDSSVDYIEVFFDAYREGEYSLVPQIEFPGDPVPDGYFKDTEVLSATAVTISGPATEINKIDRVYAKVAVDRALTSTRTFPVEIVPTGEFGTLLRYLTVNRGNADITMTIPVYKLAELPVAVSFKNVPPAYLTTPLKYSCSPVKALFAVDESALGDTKAMTIGSIDFALLKPGVNSLVFEKEDITQAKVMDDTKQFRVSVDTSGMIEKELNLKPENINFTNIPQGLAVSYDGIGIYAIKAVGPEIDLQSITSADVYADIDVGAAELTVGRNAIPARLYIRNTDTCWVYGQYTLTVDIAQ